METLKEAVKYFKQNEGYNRLFKEMKNKYISLGEMKGNVIISKPTQEEKQALSGLMKKDYSKNTTISINLKKLQQALDKSKFEGIELVQILKEYFKEEILTKKENLQIYENDFNNFLEEILQENEKTDVYKYLKNSIDNKDKLYLYIKKHYNKEKEILKQELLNACKCVNNLPNERLRIPVFASKIISNPHGIDKKNLCGKIFISLLCYIEDIPYPKNSEELSEIYYIHNLLVDDVSNMVLCKNINALYKNEMHQGLAGFNKYNEPIYLTLYNLANITQLKKPNKANIAIITENPAVFMAVAEKCKIKEIPLVCTYGQVKLAGIMLLDLLKEAGYKIYYSGDLDPEGIQIADKLKSRYKEDLYLLGFDKEVYFKNISNVELANSRLEKLNNIKSKELLELCNEVRENKKAAYEEENIGSIVNFIENVGLLGDL